MPPIAGFTKDGRACARAASRSRTSADWPGAQPAVKMPRTSATTSVGSELGSTRFTELLISLRLLWSGRALPTGGWEDERGRVVSRSLLVERFDDSLQRLEHHPERDDGPERHSDVRADADE